MIGSRSAIRIALMWCAICAAAASQRASTASAEHVHFFHSRNKTLEYPGPMRFWNTAGLVISPARIVAQTGTEVPMFAAVCDGKNTLQPYERVEWMLDASGVGSIVSVAEPIRPLCLEVVSHKAKKVDNHFAVTETLPATVILTRGTPELDDDMVMPRGYTWITVTSPREGTSYITAFAPDVYTWNVRQRSATIHWIDAEWCFPGVACVEPGCPTTLTTSVVRRTTKTPISDWIVRYCITGGAPAGFSPDNAQSIEIATDENGQASVEIVPAEGSEGTTCIAMELIRSECADPSSPERLSIATSATHVIWGNPTPPQPVPVEPAPAPAPAPVPTTPATPVTPAPPAAPAAPIAPSTPTTPATPPSAPAVPAPAPRIELRVLKAPTTAQLGEDIRFEFEVFNRGNAVATDLVAIDNFDAGLRHEVLGQSVSFRMDPLEPGQSKTFGITFRVQRPGQLCHTMTVSGAGGLHESQRLCVEVPNQPPPTQPAMEIKVDGPKTVQVGGFGDFFITLKNLGEVTANDVQISASFDPALQPEATDSTNNKFLQQREFGAPVVWNLGPVPPHKEVRLQVRCKAVAPSPHACATATMSEGTGLKLVHEACTQIILSGAPLGGAQNISVSIVGRNNPVRVGNEANYQIVVTNGDREPQRQVELTIRLPDEMVQLQASGPADTALIEPQTIKFKPIQELRPGEKVPFNLRLRATRPGQATITATVVNPNMIQPSTATVTTNVIP